MEIKKILAAKTGEKYYVKDLDKDMHTEYGFIKSGDMKKAVDGEKLLTNKEKEMWIYSPRFIDAYEKIKRSAQIIPLKDIGAIIAYTGLESDWKILDSGSGSGGISCFLANLVPSGKVYTYDIREDHVEIVKKNIEKFGQKNITCELCNVYEGFPQKNADLIILDLPEPWQATEHAREALKVGGFLVSYSPSVPQMADFVNGLPEGLTHIKSMELIEREWEIKGRKVRPITAAVGHSGFISIVRRIS